MIKRAIRIACVAALVVPTAAAAKPQPMSYKGKTKEGTKISFVLDRGWVDQLDTLLPTTCISVQGGTPQVNFTPWGVPYKFRLGYTAKLKYGDPTKYYTITTHRRATRIIGKLSMNYSVLGTDGFGDYVIWHCLATANFDLRPR
jgi:hypothetical protein